MATIPGAVEFYRDALGFGLMAQLGAQAAFLSAGGYHHHIGANVWESAGASPPPPNEAALRHLTIVAPHEGERERLAERLGRHGHAPQETEAGLVARDPSGNQVVLAVATDVGSGWQTT